MWQISFLSYAQQEPDITLCQQHQEGSLSPPYLLGQQADSDTEWMKLNYIKGKQNVLKTIIPRPVVQTRPKICVLFCASHGQDPAACQLQHIYHPGSHNQS